MEIKITKTDCVKIVNKKFTMGGDGGNTPLELALAKKCLALYDRLGEINNERNEYFEAIYSATIKFKKAAKSALEHKRMADLARGSKMHFAAAVKMNAELKEMTDGSGENQN